MKNADTMTLDECRDFIALAMGATPGTLKLLKETGDHAIPATLDGAAASLPEGCRWNMINWMNCKGFGAAMKQGDFWHAFVLIDNWNEQIDAEADNELLARFRCCVKAWMHIKAEGAP